MREVPEYDPIVKARHEAIKSLKEYTIQVDVPTGAVISGLIPSSIPNKGFFKIQALSYEEARKTALSHINSFRN